MIEVTYKGYAYTANVLTLLFIGKDSNGNAILVYPGHTLNTETPYDTLREELTEWLK